MEKHRNLGKTYENAPVYWKLEKLYTKNYKNQELYYEPWAVNKKKHEQIWIKICRKTWAMNWKETGKLTNEHQSLNKMMKLNDINILKHEPLNQELEGHLKRKGLTADHCGMWLEENSSYMNRLLSIITEK